MISFHCENISLKCEETCFTASLGIVKAPFRVLQEKVNCFLHPYELAYYKNLKYEKKQHSYLLGRYVGKHTLQHYFPNNPLERVFISPGVFHFPVIRGLSENVQISLTHTQSLSAALIFPEEYPMGIDLELIDQEQTTAIQSQLTPHELSLFEKGLGISESHLAFLLWTAKEALAKTLKTGLLTPLPVYEIQTIEVHENSVISCFTNFPQFKSVTFSDDNIILSIVLPRKSEFQSLLNLKKGCVQFY